jgi:hypothetical protein
VLGLSAAGTIGALALTRQAAVAFVGVAVLIEGALCLAGTLAGLDPPRIRKAVLTLFTILPTLLASSYFIGTEVMSYHPGCNCFFRLFCHDRISIVIVGAIQALVLLVVAGLQIAVVFRMRGADGLTLAAGLLLLGHAFTALV